MTPTIPEALPTPKSKRWTPLRSGLLNIYKYDNEEFWYEDGKLLLRGNNGAGKSRILALQLPFLLDGEISSHRVEPDGDPAKSMDWNLLMGKHTDRLGYTWIEFGRIDENGQALYYTLGCALRAVKGKRIHSRWYFTTKLRVGEAFDLVSQNNIPLSKEKLRLALGEEGSIFTEVRDYRAAIDKALFSLGSRYASLIELLIRLRKPQLSRKLDEALLSEALSEALAPLPNGLLEDAADAFRSLESNRTELDDFQSSLAGVDRFLTNYRRYLQVATKRRCNAIRQANNAYENTRRKLNGYEEQAKQDQTKLESLATLIATTESEQQAASTELSTLKSSPEMKSAENLETARQTANTDKENAYNAKERLDRSAQKLEESRTDLNASETREAEDRSTTEKLYAQFHGATLQLDLALEEIDIPDIADRNWLIQQEAQWARLASKRLTNIRHLETRNKEVAQAKDQLAQAEQNYTQTESRANEARELTSNTAATLDKAIQELIAHYYEWHQSLKHLQMPEGDQFSQLYTDWLQDENSDDANPLENSLQTASASAQQRLAERKAELAESRKSIREDLTAKNAELQRLRDGHQEPPPAAYHRDLESRSNRPGAPLWQLVDFRENITAEQKAGFEAALEASSILDAWVSLDGSMHHSKLGDTFLSDRTSQSNGSSTTPLSDILVAAIPADEKNASAITPDQVARILAKIGSQKDSAYTWVSEDGSWCLGALEGQWSKPEAEYIGFAAREEKRKLRISNIESEIETLKESATQNEAQIQDCIDQQNQLTDEIKSAPNEAPRVEASVALRAAQSAESRAQRELQEALTRRESKQSLFEKTQEQRDTDATDLGLFDWRERLDALRDKQSDLQTQADKLWRAAEGWIRTSEELQRNRRLFEAASKENESNQGQSAEATEKAQASRIHFETLQKNLGADVKEVMARIETIDKMLKELKQTSAEQRKEEKVLEISIATLKEKQQHAGEELERNRDERAQCIEKLFLFAKADLLVEVGASAEAEATTQWAPARAMEIVRSIDETLGNVRDEDAIWSQLQSNMIENIRDLQDELSSRNQEAYAHTIDDGIYVVRCSFQGKDHPMSTLRRLLEEEVTSRQQLLEEREREIIENHLVGEIASEIQRLIREGEDWVSQMNDELSQRPTSSGIMLRFAWRVHPESPSGLDEARKQLLRAEGVWSNADREAIGRFLQQQIRAQQLADETATWQEQLAHALDYRKWHRFEIERKQDGQWKRLTKKTYGTGSGGEKAIALTIPQFAAAAAHYRSAAPTAPRLIMLDEAFVGIDSATRSKLMGLLATFDLDLVMTSEREWGCYPTVSGIAIYQLSAHPSIDAVGVTRWVWNGKERKQLEQPPPHIPATNEAETGQPQLFTDEEPSDA